MATIEKRKNGNGFSFRVSIRRKGIEIYKTFKTEEDANLYAFYKERLIDNMEAFDVPLKSRVTLRQIIELKISTLDKSIGRAVEEFEIACDRVSKFLDKDKFIDGITFDEWLNIAKSMLQEDVFHGSKTENGKRKMSLGTLRRYFANISSAISYAQTQGIEINNIPLKVMQIYINPKIKNK